MNLKIAIDRECQTASSGSLKTLISTKKQILAQLSKRAFFKDLVNDFLSKIFFETLNCVSNKDNVFN